jgi:hypothetical protein
MKMLKGMDYKKPSKERANEAYLQQIGIIKDANPYEEEQDEQKKLFLIVCEGKNTEPKYFESFPIPSKTVITEGGKGSKTALVKYALEIRETEKYEGREVWCVFDFDIKPDEAATQHVDFNNAIVMAAANGMKVAWSNDAFELWFILHYQALDVAITRNEMYPILKKNWDLDSFSSEAKKVKFCEGHYKRHGGSKSENQNLAIKRAKALHDKYGSRNDFSNHCPCTTVYQLVEELNKYI